MSGQRSAEEIRTRLVEIDDEVRALPDDDFAGKHRLRSEGDLLRRELADLGRQADAAVLAAWSDRAGRKAAHTADDDVEQAKAAIVSPLDTGGGST